MENGSFLCFMSDGSASSSRPFTLFHINLHGFVASFHSKWHCFIADDIILIWKNVCKTLFSCTEKKEQKTKTYTNRKNMFSKMLHKDTLFCRERGGVLWWVVRGGEEEWRRITFAILMLPQFIDYVPACQNLCLQMQLNHFYVSHWTFLYSWVLFFVHH